MLCANCGHKITGVHLRAGLNGSAYCRKNCAYEAYEGFYTKIEVNKRMVEIKNPKGANATLQGQKGI